MDYVSDVINDTARMVNCVDYITKRWSNCREHLPEIIQYISFEIFINGFSFEDNKTLHDFRIIAEYLKVCGVLIPSERLRELSFWEDNYHEETISNINEKLKSCQFQSQHGLQLLSDARTSKSLMEFFKKSNYAKNEWYFLKNLEKDNTK